MNTVKSNMRMQAMRTENSGARHASEIQIRYEWFLRIIPWDNPKECEVHVFQIPTHNFSSHRLYKPWTAYSLYKVKPLQV